MHQASGAVLFQFSRKPQFLTKGLINVDIISVANIYIRLFMNRGAKLRKKHDGVRPFLCFFKAMRLFYKDYFA